MSAKERADLITKLYKFVKKNYQVVDFPSNRTVLEHLIYGCCLENSTFEAADEVFAKLQENYFDWNEIRVTTVAELAEVTKGLGVPAASAESVKKTLQGVFEHYYQFDLDFLRKENLSKAVQVFQKCRGVTPFVVSHVAQNGLGGHSIPLDEAIMGLFYVLGIVSRDDAFKGKVSGLERTIPKSKGVEFFNLVHQFAVEFYKSPSKPAIREKISKLSPIAKERFPKRGKKILEPIEPEKPAPAKAEAEPVKAEAEPAKKDTKAKSAKAAKPVKKKAVAKPAKKAKAVKKPTKKSATKDAKKKATKKVAKKKVAKKKVVKKKASPKKVTKKKVTKKKSPSKSLKKKKPR